MKIKIKSENYGTRVTVTDENGNELKDISKIEIDAIEPGNKLVTAKIHVFIKEIEMEAESKLIDDLNNF